MPLIAHSTSPAPRRRALLMGITLIIQLAAGQSLRGQPETVVVLTSYPDALVSRFETAFERRHPEYAVQVLWRNSTDAQNWLESGARADVFWSPSAYRYQALKLAGALLPLEQPPRQRPDTIGNTRISDADGYYLASEVSAYGFALHPQRLAELGLPRPEDWQALRHPDYRGHLVLPAGQVGFAPVMIDILLQYHGWQAGWELWSEIAANARFSDRGGSLLNEALIEGEAALAVTIDFFAMGAIADGQPLDFIYPAQGGLNPAYIAMPVNTENPQGAQAFIDFVLSREGQNLLTHPDIRRLPVNPEVYQQLPDTHHNPFSAAQSGGYDYNSQAGHARLPLLSQLYRLWLEEDHETLSQLWWRLQAAEAEGRDMAHARTLLSPPVTEQEVMSLASEGPQWDADRLDQLRQQRAAHFSQVLEYLQ